MDQSNRRAPLREGRRINVNLNLAQETNDALLVMGGGNRSAAVDELVRERLERTAKDPAP